MRLLENKQRVFGNDSKYASMIGAALDQLHTNPAATNQKKTIELCHVGKFLMLLGEGNRILRLLESPDFIVSVNGEHFGLEHQIVLDAAAKEREGFIENIFAIAESELAADDGIPNFLANCYIVQNFSGRLSDKARLINEVKSVVLHYLKHNVLPDNSIIDRISVMNHSNKNLCPNFGAWWQKYLPAEILMSAISRKETKIQEYVHNTGLRQWLLLVIGGVNGSSYVVDESMQLDCITKFNKVYLLEDFSERLYEVK